MRACKSLAGQKWQFCYERRHHNMHATCWTNIGRNWASLKHSFYSWRMSADRQQEKKAWNHQNEKQKTLNNWKIQFEWFRNLRQKWDTKFIWSTKQMKTNLDGARENSFNQECSVVCQLLRGELIPWTFFKQEVFTSLSCGKADRLYTWSTSMSF